MSGKTLLMEEDIYEGPQMSGGKIRRSLNAPPLKDESGNVEVAETVSRFAATGVGIVSLLCENIIGHPCVVARRQCQVHRKAVKYHLAPFSLLHTLVKIQRRQGFGALWKGASSVCIVRGLSVASEAAIAEIASLPREVSWHSSIKHLLQHVTLKGCSYVLLTPFLCASLIETVQSDIASEKPGVFDFLKEGLCRLFRWGTPQSPRLFPIWMLIVPTALHSVLNYMISSVVKSVVSWILVLNLRRRHEMEGAVRKGWPSTTEQHYCEVTASFVGNLIADITLYPYETVLHRLYLQGTRTIIDNFDTGTSVTPVISTYQGIFDCFHTTVQEEGAAGLYKGFGALILQYTIYGVILKGTQVCISKVTYLLQTKNRPL